MISHPEQLRILGEVEKRTRTCFAGNGSGHDFDHILRVYRIATKIAGEENCDLFVVSLAALLHDVGDYKLSADGTENHRQAISDLLSGLDIPQEITARIAEIVENVSFKGNGVSDKPMSPEGCCVRDADRLDAMGAIGVARAFAYGALKSRPMYDPDICSENFNSFEAYQNNKSHTINHFYEKLLLLKDRMETPTGKKMAEGRHAFLEKYLNEFVMEWRSEA